VQKFILDFFVRDLDKYVAQTGAAYNKAGLAHILYSILYFIGKALLRFISGYKEQNGPIVRLIRSVTAGPLRPESKIVSRYLTASSQ